MANVLWIYDVIGGFFGMGAVTPITVRDDLAKLDKRERLLVRVNSPGGVVDDAVAIRSLLAEWPSGVDFQVDGVAASAASFLAATGERVTMARGARLMIHDPWGGVYGNEKDFRRAADQLATLRIMIADAYATKSGKSVTKVLDAMADETWFSDAEAIDFGLADGRVDVAAAACAIPKDLGYRNVPQDLLDGDSGEQKKPTPACLAATRWRLELTKLRLRA